MRGCPYCYGSRRVRHEKPEAITYEFWSNITGILGLCPLCKGQGTVAFEPTGEPLEGIILVSTKGPDQRALAGCPSPECKKWLDITPFLKDRVSPYKAMCPSGHELTLEVQG